MKNLEVLPYVKIYVLNDNHEYDDYLSDWGIAFLIVTPYDTFLFDTGPSAYTLLFNSEKLGLNINDVKFIIISHDHTDHVGGLEGLSWYLNDIEVYIPSHSDQSLSLWIKKLGYRVVKIDKTTIIARGVAIIGELYGPPWEQALAINVRNGLILITGCSHPGVESIVKKAVNDLNVKMYSVIGGFHLAGALEDEIRKVISELITLGVKKIYPMHCSGNKIREILMKNYPEIYGDGHVGLILEIK